MVVEKVPELVREGKRHRARERALERALETETHLRERETLAEWAREEQRERGVMSFVLRMDGRKPGVWKGRRHLAQAEWSHHIVWYE